MNESTELVEHVRGLFEAGLYEDVCVFADILIGMLDSAESNGGGDFATTCDPRDRQTVYQFYGQAALSLKRFKLAESLFSKALQLSKSSIRPSKSKTQSNLVSAER